MCAIFGTSDKEKYKTLYELNHKRGGFALGACFIDQDCEPKVVKKRDYTEPYCCAKYMLAHDQAPTSSVRGYHFDTSHPFESKNWIVAHNGVLTNHKELLPDHLGDVDSSYIPSLLERETNREITAIKNTFSILEGTFSCWIINKMTCNIYLVKQGSTLFADGTTFSSVRFDGCESLEDGKIYIIREYVKTIDQVSTFTSNNPFALI